MADDFLYGQARQLNRNFHKNLTEAKQIVSNQNERISQLQQECAETRIVVDQWRAHYSAQEKVLEKAMAIIDETHGADKNPLRQLAYDDSTSFRIPSGDRKGQKVTLADHIYLTQFSEVFGKHFARVYTQYRNWKEFLHARISY